MEQKFETQERNEIIFNKRIFDQKTYEQIASEHGLTLERVRQIVFRKIKKIEKMMVAEKKVLAYLESAKEHEKRAIDAASYIHGVLNNIVQDLPDYISDNLDIKNLELSIRTYNCLKNERIKNLRELQTKSHMDILRIPNIGRRSLNEIIQVMSVHGLSLKEE